MPEMHPDPNWNGVSHQANWQRVWYGGSTAPPRLGEGMLQCWCGLTRPLPEGERT